ncbi:MAG TPA: adenylate/guanylate cyclase domain-containing protein [Terriglobales bacterium]|nr:adenylate/guanylate cyclase domain-containing protein [Terriglobales bacterium]
MEPENSVTQIISASRMNPGMLAELEKFRRKVTVMFTDIKGSTSYFEKHGDIAGLMMVSECNELLEKAVQKQGGRVIKTIGDAIMATFDSARAGVLASVEMQKSLAGFNAPRPEQDWVTIRIGINVGTGIVKKNDVFGDVVNVASRVESVAQPEQIVISDAVHQEISTDPQFKLRHLGRFALKGKEEQRDLFEVVWQEKKLVANAAAVHTVVMSTQSSGLTAPSQLKVQQVKQDGSVGAEGALKDGQLTVGSAQGDLKFPGDPRLAPLHARFRLQGKQLVIEDLSGDSGGGVFVRLVGPYTLLDGDQVMMGNQVFRFREKAAAMAAAAATGTAISELSAILNEPVAEMVRIAPPDPEEMRFPLIDETVTWGRSKGTYTFPNDGFMSGAHCKIYQRGENFFLEDVGSRNGTFVRVRGAGPVPVGSSVKVGGQILRVVR